MGLGSLFPYLPSPLPSSLPPSWLVVVHDPPTLTSSLPPFAHLILNHLPLPPPSFLSLLQVHLLHAPPPPFPSSVSFQSWYMVLLLVLFPFTAGTRYSSSLFFSLSQLVHDFPPPSLLPFHSWYMVFLLLVLFPLCSWYMLHFLLLLLSSLSQLVHGIPPPSSLPPLQLVHAPLPPPPPVFPFTAGTWYSSS